MLFFGINFCVQEPRPRMPTSFQLFHALRRFEKTSLINLFFRARCILKWLSELRGALFCDTWTCIIWWAQYRLSLCSKIFRGLCHDYLVSWSLLGVSLLLLFSLLILKLHVLEVIAEHEKDRYEVPDHWKCQTRDELFKIEFWRHAPVVYSATYVADNEDTENNGDTLNTLIQVVPPLSDLSEWMK